MDHNETPTKGTIMARPDPELIKRLSNNVADVARRIESPKTDPDDLRILAETLEMSADTLRIIRASWIESL